MMLPLLFLFLCPFCAAFFSWMIFPYLKRGVQVSAFFLSVLPLGILFFPWEGGMIGGEINKSLFPTYHIAFHLKVDSLAFLFLFLTTVITPFVVGISKPSSLCGVYYGFIFFLEGLLIGFFTASDLILFVVFWEAMLFPIYFLMIIFGGTQGDSHKVALRFLMYMICGSVLLIAAALSLYMTSSQRTFDVNLLAKYAEYSPYAIWICAIFLLSFAVKTPLFPFHGWLAETYTQASTGTTILLSALLSKAGVFGFLRIAYPLFPSLMKEFAPVLMGLALVGVIWGLMNAWMQPDFKRLVSYLSFSGVNFICVGLFSENILACEGALLQVFNHGITLTALFIVMGWLEKRVGNSVIEYYSGLSQKLPRLCYVTWVFVLATVALPGTGNFIGEFLILCGLFSTYKVVSVILGGCILMTVITLFQMMQKLYWGPPIPKKTSACQRDLQWKEMILIFPLGIAVFVIGLYPQPILNVILSICGANS